MNRISRLQEIIDQLGRDGPEATSTYDLLHKMETTQKIFFSHRHWLLKELRDSKLIQFPGLQTALT